MIETISDTNRMTELGFPTSHVRSKTPVTQTQASSSAATLLKRRRVHTTVLSSVLRRDVVYRTKDPQTIEELLKRREENRGLSNRVSTIMDSLFDDLIAVRTRRSTIVAMYLLFMRDHVHGTTLFYNPNRHGFEDGKSTSGPTPGIPMEFATLILDEPDEVQDSEYSDQDKEAKKQHHKDFLARLDAMRADDHAVLAQLKTPPSERHAELLTTMLAQLERYGAIWIRAGHYIRPSLHNADPRKRASFAVIGLFPEPLLDYCRTHLGAGKGKQTAVESDDAAVQLFVQYFNGWRAKSYDEPRSLGKNFAYGYTGAVAVY